MFKKGVITDEISQDFNIAVELALKYGMNAVEIRSVWEKGPHELDKSDMEKIRSIVKHAGLAVPAISSPFFKCSIDSPEEIKKHMDILRKSIQLAQRLDAEYIRGFTFWGKGGFEENLDKIVSRFEEPLKILEKEDKTLVLEFDPSVFATNAEKLVKVIRGIGSEKVKALWDPGNDIYDTDNEVPYPGGYEIIKPFMAHMHLKDAKRLDNGKIVGMPIGEGQVDYKGHFKCLIDDGYEGYIMLETHYRPKHDLSEELMALPKGSAFSYMGYEATEDCMIKWNELLEGVIQVAGIISVF